MLALDLILLDCICPSTMPNRYQLALVVSTVASFSALFLLSRAVLGLLSRAGYDPANIILIGLPSTPAQPAMSLLSSVDLGHVLTSPALVALAVTIAGTFYYFFHSSSSPCRFSFLHKSDAQLPQPSPGSSTPRSGSNFLSRTRSKSPLTLPCKSRSPPPPGSPFISQLSFQASQETRYPRPSHWPARLRLCRYQRQACLT